MCDAWAWGLIHVSVPLTLSFSLHDLLVSALSRVIREPTHGRMSSRVARRLTAHAHAHDESREWLRMWRSADCVRVRWQLGVGPEAEHAVINSTQVLCYTCSVSSHHSRLRLSSQTGHRAATCERTSELDLDRWSVCVCSVCSGAGARTGGTPLHGVWTGVALSHTAQHTPARPTPKHSFVASLRIERLRDSAE